MFTFKQHLTELSKKTLGSYVKKASDDVSFNSFMAGSESPRKTALVHDKKAFKRQTGISKAVDKLTKESIDESVVLPGSMEHMSHAVHSVHVGETKSANPGLDSNHYETKHYHIHRAGYTNYDPNTKPPTHHKAIYIVHHKYTMAQTMHGTDKPHRTHKFHVSHDPKLHDKVHVEHVGSLSNEEVIAEKIGPIKKGQMHKDLHQSPDHKETSADIAKEKAKGGVFAKRAIFAQNAKKWHHEDVQVVDQSDSAYFGHEVIFDESLKSYKFIYGTRVRDTIKRAKDLVKNNPEGAKKIASHTDAHKGSAQDVQIRTIKKHLTKEEIVDEKLAANASAGDTIDDFVHSKNKMFSGDSKKQRIKRALGAYYSKKNEEVVNEGEPSYVRSGKKLDMHRYAMSRPAAPGTYAYDQEQKKKAKKEKPFRDAAVTGKARDFANEETEHLDEVVKEPCANCGKGFESHHFHYQNGNNKPSCYVGKGADKGTPKGDSYYKAKKTVKEEVLLFENEEMSDEAHELVMHADNHAQLHHGSHMPIINNLKKKMKKGVYDPEKAKKLWHYHADRAAQSYHKEYGDKHTPWHHMFPTHVRREAAAHWEVHHRTDLSD